MRLLVITQTVDSKDPVLGFFHRWLMHFAPHFDRIEVICLFEGVHALPENVRVHSLGKEKGRQGRLAYVWRFAQLLWRLRSSYDSVFVHMNQEYVLIGGWWWLLTGKPIYLWRNHWAGNFLTDIAAMFCTKIFCTSRGSYTAKFKKTRIMPVGIDTDFFTNNSEVVPRTILSLGRIAPSKRIDVLIDALEMLTENNVVCDVYGDALTIDQPYLASLKERSEKKQLPITFHGGVPNDAARSLYGTHALFVNLSESGMYDKTILEAAACESLVLAASPDFAELAGEDFSFSDTSDLTTKLQRLLELAPEERENAGKRLRSLVIDHHSLKSLSKRLREEMAHFSTGTV